METFEGYIQYILFVYIVYTASTVSVHLDLLYYGFEASHTPSAYSGPKYSKVCPLSKCLLIFMISTLPRPRINYTSYKEVFPFARL